MTSTSIRRSNRALYVAAAIIVCLLIALAGFVLYMKHVQDCRDARSAAFFTAEQNKVAGQVAGLLELRSADGDRAKATDGFNKFIDASQHYLVVIAKIKESC